MNKKQKLGQEPAFANGNPYKVNFFTGQTNGMNKRFYAACVAMQGILSNPNTAQLIQVAFDRVSVEESYRAVAVSAFSIADALLKQENL